MEQSFERFHFTIKQKLYILNLVGSGQRSLVKLQFPEVTDKQIVDWQRLEQRMRALSENDQRIKYTLHPGPSQTRKELYQFLYQIVKELRLDRKAVTVDYLIHLAEAEDVSIQQMTYSGKKSMIRRFMEFFNLSIREVTGFSGATENQIEEEQKIAIDSFKDEYRRIVQTYQIPSNRIFNMDQTGILYENTVSRTIDFSGTREIPVQTQGDEKKRLTLFSLINAKGDLFTQLIVYKGAKNARIHTEVQEYDEWTTFHSVQENAWCDGLTLIEWIYRIWQPLVSRLPGPKLLILDSYPLHQDLQEKFAENDVHVMFIPTGLTWALQPLDCGFFKVLKDELKSIWIKNQHTVLENEKNRREAISSDLKQVFERQFNNDFTVFWKKAGLEPPHVYPPRINEESMMMEEVSQETVAENSAMAIEESDHDDNLFA